MPFGLKNAPSTFQRLMSHVFNKYLRDYLKVYMDDLCVHSKDYLDLVEHLKLVFEKCKIYQIFLNLHKCVFMV